MIRYYDPMIGQVELKEAGITAMPSFAKVLKFNPNHGPDGLFAGAGEGASKGHEAVLGRYGYRKTVSSHYGDVHVLTYEKNGDKVQVETNPTGTAWVHTARGVTGLSGSGKGPTGGAAHLDDHLAENQARQNAGKEGRFTDFVNSRAARTF